ncbi:MAG TPA: c-type cytochrome [Burkholderiaceae bacterium]|jgi:mono/diheme cytochrome c family protein|nr:c-type cytochrome [Burkholderiaceae bacterium]
MHKALVVCVLSLLCLAAAAPARAADAATLARGKQLMEGIVACGNCHTAVSAQGEPQFGKPLAGGFRFDDPGFAAYAPNITPDVATGIGGWTDAELGKAIREGIGRDGRLIGPPMPIGFYRHIADADLAAIIAWLRAQPAVSNAVPKSVYRIPLPPNYGPAVGSVAAPPQSDKVRYGEYLANIGHCMDCHTPRDDKGMLIRAQWGAGGQAIPGPWGVSISRNLTPGPGGLKDWTDAQIAHTIRSGLDRKGQPLKPPMAFWFYKNIDDADMAALIAYLRSLGPLPFAGKS